MPPAKRGLTITPTSHSLLNTSLDSSDSSFVSTKENGSSRSKGQHTLNNNVQHSKHHSATSHQSSPHHRREERRHHQEMDQQKTAHSLKNGTDKVSREEKPAVGPAVESSAGSGGGSTTVLNGMQFKIISRGKSCLRLQRHFCKKRQTCETNRLRFSQAMPKPVTNNSSSPWSSTAPNTKASYSPIQCRRRRST
jgi:hypothetical protein